MSVQQVWSDFDDLVNASPLFQSVGRLEALETEANWVEIKGGDTLCEEGEQGDCLYAIVYGRLCATVKSREGREVVVGEMSRGECVGEMALLTNSPRSATVRAIRDTGLIALSRAAFTRIAEKRPQAVLELATLLCTRLQRANQSYTRKLGTVAIVPCNVGVPTRHFIDNICRVLAKLGNGILRLDRDELNRFCDDSSASHLSEQGSRRLANWLHEQEAKHDFIIYESEPLPSDWTELCVRQADLVLLVADAGSTCELGQPLKDLFALDRGGIRARAELVLLYENGKKSPKNTIEWLSAGIEFGFHHHIEQNVESDYERLVRLLTGNAIGIALGGGGARGFAHIGVLRALDDSGIPIDLIGGTSMGAIISAQYAAGWDSEAIVAASRKAFLESGRLVDLTIPLMAIVRGRRFMRVIAEMYGDLCIEDLLLPYFCVSTNLTKATYESHTRGAVRKAVLASAAVPGLGPPVFFNRQILVDGGISNNLPVDVVRNYHRGPVFAVNVSADKGLPLDGDYPDAIAPFRVLTNWLNPLVENIGVPSIFSILMQAACLGQADVNAMIHNNVDLLFEPPVADFKLLEFKAIDKIVETGYQSAMETIEQWRERSC